jgi:hypothetical protein
MKSGIEAGKLVELVLSLHEEDRLSASRRTMPRPASRESSARWEL